MDNERAVFNEETGLWYRQNDLHSGIRAATYPEAFELLYGHPVPLPPNVRAPRHESVFAVD